MFALKMLLRFCIKLKMIDSAVFAIKGIMIWKSQANTISVIIGLL